MGAHIFIDLNSTTTNGQPNEIKWKRDGENWGRGEREGDGVHVSFTDSGQWAECQMLSFVMSSYWLFRVKLIRKMYTHIN